MRTHRVNEWLRLHAEQVSMRGREGFTDRDPAYVGLVRDQERLADQMSYQEYNWLAEYCEALWLLTWTARVYRRVRDEYLAACQDVPDHNRPALLGAYQEVTSNMGREDWNAIDRLDRVEMRGDTGE